MRLWFLALGLGAALAGSPAAAGSLPDENDARTHIMWFPSDRIWTAGLPAEACGPRLIEANGSVTLAAPLRRATFERRGEIVAELRAPAPLRPAVLTQAKSCAARAAGGATLSAMLTPAPEPWTRFQGALSACLKRVGAADQVGSMTLWIDTSCNW